MTTTGLLRDPLDKFYTRPEVVQTCLDVLRTLGCVQSADLVVEPSAGAGAFSKALVSAFPDAEVTAYDLVPEAEDGSIVQQDFLLLDTTAWAGQRVHVVGNPPFGRQSGLAKRFIKKACEHAQTLAFVLPKSFKKPSMQACVPPCFHLERALDLPDDAFVCHGTPHAVPCVFQVWVRKTTPRPTSVPVLPTYYTYVSKEDAHVAVRRVGVNAGKAWRVDASHSPQSHYFLSLGDRVGAMLTDDEVCALDYSKLYTMASKMGVVPTPHPKKAVLEAVLAAKTHQKDMLISKWLETYTATASFSHDNTVGPRSISKPELNAVLNAL